MKIYFATLILSLAGAAGIAYADSSPGTGAQPHQVQMAQKFSVYLPQTLVVRKDRLGHVAIYQSQQKLQPGQKLSRGTQFTTSFSTHPQSELGAQWWGNWSFWWNFGVPYAYPTYGFYNPYYGFRYNYYYTPYYHYYSPYDYDDYWYYGWRRW